MYSIPPELQSPASRSCQSSEKDSVHHVHHAHRVHLVNACRRFFRPFTAIAQSLQKIMSSIKLTYFNLRARGEPARLLFALAGKK